MKTITVWELNWAVVGVYGFYMWSRHRRETRAQKNSKAPP